jgi:hypothetical protein
MNKTITKLVFSKSLKNQLKVIMRMLVRENATTIGNVEKGML